jgi:hypothetical protein
MVPLREVAIISAPLVLTAPWRLSYVVMGLVSVFSVAFGVVANLFRATNKETKKETKKETTEKGFASRVYLGERKLHSKGHHQFVHRAVRVHDHTFDFHEDSTMLIDNEHWQNFRWIDLGTTNLNYAQCLQLAKKRGDKKYCLFFYNCQHFADELSKDFLANHFRG